MATDPKKAANDQRSTVKNPTSKQYPQDRQNRIEQGHANVPPPAPPKK